MTKVEQKMQSELLFLAGSCGYPALELIWRGHTHYSMALAGGLCVVLINRVCCERMAGSPLPARCVMGSVIITGVELAVGAVFNGWMGLKVWDYSSMPLNFMGQICLPYSLLWCGLSLPVMALCRATRKLKFS